MRQRLLLLTNPNAGISGSTLVGATLARLRAAGAVVELCQPASADALRQAAEDAARQGRFDAAIAAGGDGTIRQVAAGLLGTEMPLALIPVGTGNVLAHEIALDPTPEAVADMLLHGRVIRVSTSRANGAPFLLMASAGLDARVVAKLDQRLKSSVGKVAYAAPILGALAKPLDRLRVEVDGVRCVANWAIIANAAHYAGPFVLTRRTDIAGQGLEAVLFKARTRGELVSQIFSLARGRLSERCTQEGDVEMIPCARVTITAEKPVPTQLDGDLFGVTPLVVEAATDRLQLVVPRHSSLR